MTPLTRITNHEARALATLPSQWRDSPKVRALVAILARRSQHLEDTAWDLYSKRGVETAEGVQLDILGKLVGQRRLGLSDGDYRRLISVRILANRAGGRADVIAQVVAGVVQATVTYTGPTTGGSGHYRLSWKTNNEPSANLLAQLRLLLDEISPSGVSWEAIDSRKEGFAFAGSDVYGWGFGEPGTIGEGNGLARKL